jgi:hypothetical protein
LQRTLNIGIGAVGLILVAYGCLGMIQNGKLFLGLSMVLRVLEACGNSAFLTGSFSAIARCCWWSWSYMVGLWGWMARFTGV